MNRPSSINNQRDARTGSLPALPDQQSINAGFDIICLSHLRWDFVYQRPNHLMSRWARQQRVFFVEEPLLDAGPARLAVYPREQGLSIVVPYLTEGTPREEWDTIQQELLAALVRGHDIEQYVLWYYTPMAINFTRDLTPLAVVYDCMDELSAFSGAPPELRASETELMARADLVFTGGVSLYEAKRSQHPNVYPFPSSVDVSHFGRARNAPVEPADQADIAHPRLGFFGVLDERLNRDLVAGIADARPDWQLVLVGPVVKIDPAELPQRPNIHYLGGKSYAELPEYLSGWDVALLPFARNEATRFISPTKTPEYLAAGRPVVSTSIHDVVRPYGESGLVRIADTAAEFVVAIDAALEEDQTVWLQQVDAFLAQMSWEHTWGEMRELICDQIKDRQAGAAIMPAPRSQDLVERAVGGTTTTIRKPRV